MRIIVDMDEVLSDFVDGAARLHGITKDQYFKKATAGCWGMAANMQITDEEFWKPIHEVGEEFWMGLARLPWWQELITIVDKASDGHWLISTSPSAHPGSKGCTWGKIHWLETVFGKHFDRYSVGPHKHFYAYPNTILIDDRGKNCEDFRKHGGKAILFPSFGNQYHQMKDSPLTHVRESLKLLGANH